MSEVAEIVGGSTPSTDESDNFASPGIPWITPADLSGYRAKLISHGARDISEKGLASSSTRLMPAGTVLFSSRAPIGYVAIAANPVTTNQGFKSFVLSTELLPDYVYYWLIRAKDLLSQFASGTTFLEISGKRAQQIPLPIAPLNEQRRIVGAIESVLPKLDAAVAALERVRANLKRYRASILKAAVEGRLVPTEAELARKEGRDYEPASVLLDQILAARRRRWEESELARLRAAGKPPKDDGWKSKYKEPAAPDTSTLPPLPEGWCWSNVGQLTWSVKDGPHYSPKYSESGVPFITGGNVRPSGVDFENAKRISKELHSNLSIRCKPEFGDILYTKGGTTGIARVNTYRHEFSVWVHVAVLKLCSPIEPFYVQHCLNSPTCYAQAQRFTHGVGNQDLGLTRMVNIVLPLPPRAEQLRIVSEVDRLASLIDSLDLTTEANEKRLPHLRQTILKCAFEGKLVDQDPNDEPASVLLERIRAERAAASTPSRKSRERFAHETEAVK